MNLETTFKKPLKKRLKKQPVQLARNATQILFSLFLLYIGYRFYQFYLHFATFGLEPFVERPAAVEGFLPISALVALKVWLSTGHFDTIHPAGLVLFTFFVGSGIIFKRIFCSWMCPIGTISEFVGNIGKKIFKRNYNPPRWLTWFLYPLKYLILFFFVKAILIDMPAFFAYEFLNSTYNKISDVKMMLFFLNISGVAFTVILVLLLLSLFIKNFWCRFLCPYGAFIGLGSIFTLTKFRRNEASCIDCKACTRACPNGIDVATKKAVLTPECTACMQCVEACPVKDTLDMTVATKKVNKWILPVGFFALFFIVIFYAKMTGHWTTNITYLEFKDLIFFLD
ncbi:4Fe-4S binding protein [Anaerobacillus sp. CMMVII]|uniref:4Fe-4S binding protein n=1 Tax=Anaerobacillus sp. CMMVII TaxID=2755588 RepID=UPI0021B70441|nr:4Fe-4S binding protein [Anaerobacillus sp. CMMVII]MCT8137703.1 4Fe-4S binding protein [Anaerobacillus sp. CMMVII]